MIPIIIGVLVIISIAWIVLKRDYRVVKLKCRKCGAKEGYFKCKVCQAR